LAKFNRGETLLWKMTVVPVRRRLYFEGSHHPKGVHLPDRKGFSGELEML